MTTQKTDNACRDAIATVCEGFTLSADVRKILEKALWAAPVDASAPPVLPEGWIALSIIYDEDMNYPEEVAYGPKRMMDRLGKWLDKYLAMRIAESAKPAVAPVAGQDERALSEAAILDIFRQQTNPSAMQKYGDAFERIARAIIAALAAPVAEAQPVARDVHAALDEQYPIPDSPHGSVIERNASNRIAFVRGWDAAMAAQPADDGSLE